MGPVLAEVFRHATDCLARRAWWKHHETGTHMNRGRITEQGLPVDLGLRSMRSASAPRTP